MQSRSDGSWRLIFGNSPRIERGWTDNLNSKFFLPCRPTGEYADSSEFEFYDDPDDGKDLESIEDESLDSEVGTLSERVRPIAVGLATKTVEWLLAHKRAPSPELPEAWQSILLATLFSKTALGDAPAASVAEFGGKMIGTFVETVEEELRAEYERAVEQAREYIQADPEIMKLAAEKYG